ncbi:DUF1656 domain-containing protein [Neokomagataea tanensis]|uniref:DUF1656 domain-containing protein n=1 Tax=Neokomagataea tanensis TaxID=661191 RepID=A0A4Y6VAN9_9PROT|nr:MULTISPECIES: DUF1656 domain-containing protein [Neokomagataea]QDH25527.1 DUF1656 domain-containing protein [Neokomagataea tanensis]
MLAEFNIFGVFVAPVSVYALVALVITFSFRRFLWKVGLLNWIWHVPLFEIAFFVCTLCLLLMFA